MTDTITVFGKTIDTEMKMIPARICEICDESFTEDIDKYHICGRCRRKLKEFVIGGAERTEDTCKCGGKMICEVLATNPPQTVFRCNQCGMTVYQ